MNNDKLEKNTWQISEHIKINIQLRHNQCLLYI